MHWIDTVASYLPSLIVNHLINRTTNEELPSRQEYGTVCLFADVSGFTALSEAMSLSAEGVEGLAKHLNSYFGQMVRIIASEGGDVFKFAGDALIVLWPPPQREALTDITKKGREKDFGEREGTTPMERRVRRAAQCAFAIQEELHNAELTQEVRLSVKIGIGMGKVSVLHLGGVYKRMEYIAVGEPLLEAFTAEHHATPGDVIISKQAHKLVKDHFRLTQLFPDLYVRISKEQNYNPMRKQNKMNMLQQSLDDPLLEVKVKGYIPGAVLRNLRPDSPEDEHWSNEIRRVTVLFVNLGLNEQTLLAAAVYDEAMKEMHQVMVAVQESVYEYEGSINKFLMDDKGSTLVAVYGLPPVGHANDPIRGVLAALRLCERLFELAKVGSVGITTGEAFCGVVGSKTRKEYTVLGDSVNLAARLMQRALKEDGGVMCELATKRACGGLLQFKARGDFRIKGKTAAAKVFQPYPEDFPKPKPPQYLGANVYGLIHQQQRQNYAMHKLLTSLQAYFARPSAKEISSISSPVSEHRTRYSGSARGSGYNPRPSMVSAVDNGMDVGEEDEEEHEDEDEPEDTLVGLVHDDSEGSDEDSTLGILDHAELQEPSYPTGIIRMPFETGPLPLEMGMEGEVPYERMHQDRFHPEARSGGKAQASGADATAVGPPMLAESKDAGVDDNDGLDLSSNPMANPRMEFFGKSRNSRDLLRQEEKKPQRRRNSGAGNDNGIGGGGGSLDADNAADNAATTTPGRASVSSSTDGAAKAQGKEPLKSSTSLTAKVFASRASEGGSTAGRSSATMSVAGTALSGGGDYASPETLSPNSVTTEALPLRGMGGRRQGDSHLQKLFRTANDDGSGGGGGGCGGGGLSSQPTSPSAAISIEKDGRRGSSTKSLMSSSSASKGAALPSQEEEKDNDNDGSSSSGGGGGGGKSAVVSAPASTSASATAITAPALTVASTSEGSHGGSSGGLSRVPLLGGAHSGAATVMPRSRVSGTADYLGGSGGSGGPFTSLGGIRRNRKGPEGRTGSRQGRFDGKAAGKGEDEEEITGRGEGGANDRNAAGESKEELVLHPSKAVRSSFSRVMSGSVLADDEEVLTVREVGRRRRSSRRLSISQNGMVPLPASAGIPQSDLSSSGSCSLPRYSRYSKHQFGNGSSSSALSSGHGTSRNGHHPSLPSFGGTAPTYFPGSVHQAPPPPALAGSSSFTSTHAPPAMRNGRRMDDGASSVASASGAMGLQMRVHSGDTCDECRLQVVVPRLWKWSSLPELCHKLPAISVNDVATFRELLDLCWEIACNEAEVKGWSQPPPPREGMVLNILGTRVVLPMEPDYDINLLPHFVKEACGTRGSRGFTDRKRTFPCDSTGFGASILDLCLVSRKEILNVQSQWSNSRISLLQHKIALVGTKTGSVLLLEGLPGAGKTEALSVFAARTMPRTALIHFTAASPYHANREFGGWSMVLQQYLDSLHKQEAQQAGREDFSGHSGVRRMSVPPDTENEQANMCSILGQKPLGRRDRILLRELEDHEEMHAYAFLVNDVLGTNIPNMPTWGTHSSTSSSSTYGGGGNGHESDGSGFEESSSVGHKQRLKLAILLQLVKNMSATKPRVIVIDDAQFLDKESWTLALAVATGGPMGTPLPLMLILSFRPLLHYRAIFSSVAPDYKALTELDHVQFLKIPGAPPEEVEELVAEKLGTNVVEISDSLFGLVEELCTGNPLMITELVSHLKMMEPKPLRYFEIRSEEGDQGDSHNNIDVAVQVSLTDSFRLSGSILPDKLNALLTSQTDRLNSCQLMALKVASLIGKQFSTWFLYEVYPIKGHKNRLLRELAELEEQGFLVEVQGPEASVVIEREGWARPSIAGHMSMSKEGADGIGGGGGGASSRFCHSSKHLWGIPNVVYLFTHGFMMEMLQLKMLKSQTNLLLGGIQKLKDRLETQKRHKEFKNLTMDRSQKQKEGMLSVMKYKVTMSQAAMNARETTRRQKDSVTSRAMRRVKRPVQQKWTEALDWKKRRCVLTGESLSLFSDPKDAEPSQIVYLKGANAEPELGQAFKDSAFRVETNKWKKGDEVVDGSERRTFTFLADNKDDKELWLYQIRHCIEVIKVLNGETGAGSMDRMMAGSSARSSRFRGSDAHADGLGDEVDSTLVVRVERAEDLVLEETFGKVYPYCFVDLDDQNMRTSSVQCSSINPSWQEDLTFEVSIQQWVLSNLRIHVWHKDLFLTDDFLGQVTIPLADVAVHSWDEAENEEAPEPKWYTLESRGHKKCGSGRLLLGMRLFMNKPTSDRATAVGGVEKLKAIANRRMDISSHAARVGQIQQRKQSLPGLLHQAIQAFDSHHPHPHHHHHHHHHGGMPMPAQVARGMSSVAGGGGAGGNPHTHIRASIRSMESELVETSGRSFTRGRGRMGSVHYSRGNLLGGGGLDASGSSTVRSYSYLQQQLPELGDGSRHSVDLGEDRSGSGVEADGAAAPAAAAAAPRMSGRSRRRSAGGRRWARRATSDSSSTTGIGLSATEPLHTDPLTRQLMLMLLAVETKAKITTSEEGGGGSVNREWIKLKLKELLPMVNRGDLDLDQLDTHTYYCKDRKENQYGPFPAKQLVEAHNAGYINDRKVLVKEARMKGEFRRMGARALMHGPSSDEDFKALNVWPQVDAHHPLADKILSPGDSSSKDFRRWSFNIFDLETQELGMLAATILAETGLPRVFGISMKTFAHFMSAVGFFMGRNPRVHYHNLYHAVDVMHATYLTLEGMGASGLLTETEQLALILSALCHDLDHPGLTNSFQTATESPLANLYNDQAPLEHHHLAIMFQILRREGCDILGHLEKPQKARIREVMIQGILATEMSEHGTHIAKVDKLTNDFPNITLRVARWASGEDLGRRPNPVSSSLPFSSPRLPPMPPTLVETQASPPLSMSGSSRGGSRSQQVPGAAAAALGLEDCDRLTVASALLHAADLSSPGRPFVTCKVWVLRLLDEFKFQAEQERQRGLRVTVLEGLPSASQPGFIDAFLLPFFTALLPMAPGLADEYIPNLRANRNQWEAIAEQEAQLAAAADDSLAGSANSRPGDHNSTGSTSSGPGSSCGGGRPYNAGGGGLALPLSTPSATTAARGQRRFSGGTIGIENKLGSVAPVPTGRSNSDGSMDRRVSSVLSNPGTPPGFAGLGISININNNNGGGVSAAWRRQSAMGQASGFVSGFGNPRWGVVRAGGSDPRGMGEWGGEAVDEGGGAKGAPPAAPALAAGGRPVDAGADGGGGGLTKEQEVAIAQASPAKASSPEDLSFEASPPDASLAEASSPPDATAPGAEALSEGLPEASPKARSE